MSKVAQYIVGLKEKFLMGSFFIFKMYYKVLYLGFPDITFKMIT